MTAMTRASRVRRGLLVIIAVIAAVPAIGDARAGGVQSTGTFDRTQGPISRAANGSMLLDPSARRAYQAVVGIDTTLIAFDLDTLERTATLTIPPLQVAQTLKGEDQWLWTADMTHHRIFAFQEGAKDASGLENYSLLTVSLTRLTLSRPVTLWPLAERIPLAISYHAPSDRLYVLSRLKVDADGRTAYFVQEFRPDGTPVWEQRIGACYGAQDNQYAPTLARSVLRPAVYLNCYNPGGIQGLVVRLPLDAAGRPTGTQEIFPAVPGDLSTMFDPGSDRMFFLTTNSGAGRGAWVFDGLRSTFLGVIATADNRPGAFEYAMGLDPSSGRVYLQTPVGLMVADARRTPLPAGLLFGEYANPGLGSVSVDPVRHRLFVPDYASIDAAGHPGRYRVFVDDVTPSSDPAAGNPDALTTDVAERAGITDANVNGGARGFGARALLTGGAQKAAWNVALGRFSPGNLPQAWATVQNVPLQRGNRDLFGARVRGVTLTNNAADASAIGAITDGDTAKDLADHKLASPFGPAECHDDGSKPDAPSAAAGTAGASCDGAAGSVLASANALGLHGPSGVDVSVGSVGSFGSVLRDPARGTVARATATAQDVSLFGRVHIASVRSDAEAWARGRPGTAGATYTRALSGVRIDADGDGTPEFSCSVCDFTTAVAAINGAIAGFGAVELPAPDGASYPGGSPGGYQAVVERERVGALAARALNDDDTTEVAALQVVMYADGRAGRTRGVLQLAAVQAEAHYGIFLIPTDLGALAPPPENLLPAVDGAQRQPAPLHSATAPEPVKPRSVFQSIVEHIRDGWRVGFSHATDGILLGTLWSFLALPLFLALRRRSLARLDP